MTMMTAQRLAGLAERGDWDSLLGAVLKNGRPVPLEVRLRLSEEVGGAGAALGLALCRVIELTYLPGAEAGTLGGLVMGVQGEDGWFGSAAGTACAIAGLREYERQLASFGDAGVRERVSAASDAAMHALMSRWGDGDEGGWSRADLAVVLWMLCGRARAGEAWWVREREAEAVAQGLTHDAVLSAVVAPALIRGVAAGDAVVAA